MSIITPIPPETPFPKRLLLKIPVLGWIARDVLFGDRDNVIWAGVIVGTLWVLSVAQWGVAALLVPFTLAVPAALVGLFNALVWRHERRRARETGEGQPNG